VIIPGAAIGFRSVDELSKFDVIADMGVGESSLVTAMINRRKWDAWAC